MTSRPIIAIAYDFDCTLSCENMQEHKLLPALGVKSSDFWDEVKAEAEAQEADEILTYMRLILEAANRAGVSITRESLKEFGSDIKLFEGVDGWFARMNARAEAKGFELQHYIISSGLAEMILGSGIENEFKHIYASSFAYKGDTAIGPAVGINYTTKTQSIFRINKGILNSWDNTAINRWVTPSERPVPLDRMIFIGDGDTDIPCMKMVRSLGGYSIAVCNPATSKGLLKGHRLLAEDRVNYLVEARYTENSLLDITVHGIIDRIAEQYK